MSKVIDYSFSRPSVSALKSYGAIAVCRYLSWLPNGKCLSKGEADQLIAGGLSIVSNWEYRGSWADFSGGAASGRPHAVEASRQHLACGGPGGAPIYFSTDWDVTPSQMPTVADYYRGVASVIGPPRVGAYGGYNVIKYLFDHNVIDWGWQTYAWSAGRWDPRAQLRQVQNGITIGGADCDRNESMTADFGQWEQKAAVPEVELKDPIGSKAYTTRTVGQAFNDVEGLRDNLWGDAAGTKAMPLPAGSPLGKLLATPAAVASLQSTVTAMSKTLAQLITFATAEAAEVPASAQAIADAVLSDLNGQTARQTADALIAVLGAAKAAEIAQLMLGPGPAAGTEG
jgi:hypothetical protein